MADAKADKIPMATSTLHILEQLVRAVGQPFDHERAVKALDAAEQVIAPTAPRAARQRLAMAAERLGVQLISRQLSPRQAIALNTDVPIAAFSVLPNGEAHWFLIIDRIEKNARLVTMPDTSPGEPLSAEQLAKSIGAHDADSLVEWLIPYAAIPESNETDILGAETTHDEIYHGPSPLKRVWQLMRNERRELWVIGLYSIGIGLLSLATPLTAMALINAVAMTTLQQPLIVLCAILGISLLLAAGLRAIQAVVIEYLQQRIFVRVVAQLSQLLPRVRRDAFDEHHGPELVNRFFDVLTVQKSAATLLLDGFAVVLQTGVGLILLAAYHQVLLGFDLILIASLVFIVFVLGRGAVRTSIRESKAKYAVAAWIEEMARHPIAFKLSSGPRYALERADELTRDYLLARQQHFYVVMRQWGFALVLQAIASTALLGIGGVLVMNGQLSLGQLVAAEIIVTLVVASFTKFGKQLESYYDLLAAVDKLGHLIDLPMERGDGIEHPARGTAAAIRIHDVTFSYPTGHRMVLDRISLDLPPGDRVALLGPNGAGKSTLVELLFGLRTPDSGHIEIDGFDLRELKLESLRRHLALVKGIEIFEGTIVDNLRMGREEVTTANIRRALDAVGLLPEIMSLPEGLNTVLWTGGSPLSLGQAERLMLARAIVGEPRFLIIDELLDDMDQEVRHQVLPTLLGNDAPWTLLVITHSQEVAKLCKRTIRLTRPRQAVAASAPLETVNHVTRN